MRYLPCTIVALIAMALYAAAWLVVRDALLLALVLGTLGLFLSLSAAANWLRVRDLERP